MPDDSAWHEGEVDRAFIPRIWNPVRYLKWRYYRWRARQYSKKLYSPFSTYMKEREDSPRHIWYIEWLESQNRKYSDLARAARFGSANPPDEM